MRTTLARTTSVRLTALLLATALALIGLAAVAPGARAGQALGNTWYLAEGSTDWGFATVISVQNPNPNAVAATVTYMLQNGTNTTQNVNLPPASVTQLFPVNVIGNQDFSTLVQANNAADQIAVDRIMSWSTGGGNPQVIEETSSIGTNALDTNWYLAEGSSAWGFETYILVMNPNPNQVTVNLNFMLGNGTQQVIQKPVDARSRQTFTMSQLIGSKDASCQVTCTDPIAVERSMFRGPNRAMGQETVGAVDTSKTYYLAEGTTAWGFTTYVLVQNPNNVQANVQLLLQTSQGPMNGPTAQMPANSRQTFNLNQFVNQGPLANGIDLSTVVQSDVPIVAERSMYWNNNEGKQAGHCTIGVTDSHQSLYFPSGFAIEGQGGGTETWTLVQNPNNTDVKVRLTYLPLTGGQSRTQDATIPANSRQSFNMIEVLMAQGDYSVMVESLEPTKNIMAESSIYTGAVTGHTFPVDLPPYFFIDRTAGGCTIGAYK